MFDEQARTRIAAVIRERITDYGGDGDDTEAAAAYLEQNAKLPAAKADALLWGEDVSLDRGEIERLAGCLDLLDGILSCLLNAASREVAEMNLIEVMHSPHLHVERCGTCAALCEQIVMREELDDEEIVELMHNLLAHVVAPDMEDPGDELLDDVFGEDILDELGLPEGDPRQAELMRLYGLMSEEQRNRLMAFAYSEITGNETSRVRDQLAALTVLRDVRLTPLARRALDALAASETGRLKADELLRQLGLESRRSLGQLQRTVRRACRELEADGLALEGELLLVQRDGREATFGISEELLPLWRGLMRAERTPNLSG